MPGLLDEFTPHIESLSFVGVSIFVRLDEVQTHVFIAAHFA